MQRILPSDVALIRAAASLAEHAPARMRAGHLAPRLEALASRLREYVVPEADEPAADLPRAA